MARSDDKLKNNEVQELRQRLQAKGLTNGQIGVAIAIGRSRGEAAERLAEVMRRFEKA